MSDKNDTAVEEVVDKTTAESASAVKGNDSGEYTADDLPKSETDEAKDESEEEAEDKSDNSDDKEAKTDDTNKSKPEETKDDTEDKPLTPRSQNRFQKLANENRDLKSEIARFKSRETQVATEQELLDQVNPTTGDYYTAEEAGRVARQKANEQLSEELANERYALEVQQNQQRIQSEAERALADFPMFDEQSSEYNEVIAQQADELLKDSLIFDEQGVLVGSQQSPYKIYQSFATIAQSNNAKSQANAQRNIEKMASQADPSSNAPQKPKAFEKLTVKEMEAKLRAKGYDI